MADESDVEAALVAAVAQALYPAGTGEGSVTGGVYRVYRGWPGNTALEADLAAGISHVSVTAIAGSQALIEQFPPVWEVPTPTVPALSVSVSGAVVAFSGTAAPGQLAGLLVDEAAFAYRTQQGDTAASVAASLAALVNQQRGSSTSGATLEVPGATRLVGRVSADQAALMTTRRQRANFRLTCWCPNPLTRDTAAAVIDSSMAQTTFFALPDGSAARLIYVGSEIADDLATLPLYRRDLTYSVGYATTLAQMQPSMLFGIFGVVGPTSIDDVQLS